MADKNILGSILIPVDVDSGEEKLQDGTIVKWKVTHRGSDISEDLSDFREKKLSELRQKVRTPFLPDDFKPLTREEANEREE
jgi:hypothetical protein